MWKNLVITIMVISLAVMVYKYIAIQNSKYVISKQNVVVAIDDTEIRLYKYSDKSFYVQSEDKKFLFFFVYDIDGLHTFQVQDFLSGKEIIFNISNEGFLQSYKYEDNEYIIITNIDQSDTLIRRAEQYKGYRSIYELFPDGLKNITVEYIENGR